MLKVLVGFILALPLISGLPSHASNKAVFVDDCGGRETPYSSAGKACKSGKYKGASLVECKKDCTDRDFLKCQSFKWKVHEKRFSFTLG